ncbi:MAG: DUF5946 family protein [Chloroflexota bacterium]
MPQIDKDPMHSCPECGALLGTAEICEELFHAALDMEWENPLVTAAAHHLLVGTYMVQHPAGYTPEAQALFAAMVVTTVDEELSADELRRRNRGRFEQQKRNWRMKVAEPQEVRLRRWPMTIADVIDGPAVELPQRVWQWARSVRKELKQDTASVY